MFHEPAAQGGEDRASSYKMSLGVKMFIVYALVYAGFVAINIIKPTLMEKVVFLGLNLAVVYGFGLIVFALLLALVYNRICAHHEKRMNADASGEDR